MFDLCELDILDQGLSRLQGHQPMPAPQPDRQAAPTMMPPQGCPHLAAQAQANR